MRSRFVCGADHVRRALILAEPDVASFSKTSDRLHPAKDLLDAFSNSLTHWTARVPRRPRVDLRAAMARNVLRNVRRRSANPSATSIWKSTSEP